MKKILFIVGAAAVVFTAAAQDVATPITTNVIVKPVGPEPEPTNFIPTTLDQIIALVGTPTNYAVEPYLTYAPKAPTKFGGGILGIWNMNQHVGMGIGLDWLGSFSLVSGNVQLQAPFHPLPHQIPDLILDPFVIGGIATAYGGAGKFNGNVSTVQDIGAALKFGHVAGGQFNLGACYGQWTGVGSYDVKRYHFFLGWSHGF